MKKTPQQKDAKKNSASNKSKHSLAVKRPTSISAASQNWKVLLGSSSIGQGQIKKKSKMLHVNPKEDDKHYVPFSSIPKEQLNHFGMIKYDATGKIVTRMPSNIAPHVMEPTPIIGLDSEFVDIRSCGELKRELTVARISVVNEYGFQLYHAFVKPKSFVQDYLTEYSGVRAEDLENGVSLEEAQNAVHKIIAGRILVGHSINNDLQKLKMQHPKHSQRDTAKFFAKCYKRTPALKKLVQDFFGINIQGGEHLPTEDAQAALKIYLNHRSTWEALRKQKILQMPPTKSPLPNRS